MDAAVSPARSLDDESVSSAGLTDAESPLRSPTSSGSSTSQSFRYEHGDDELALMSHLLRIQPLLLSRSVVDNRLQPGTALPYHVDWMAVGLAAAAEERRRQLLTERSPKTSARQLDRSSATNPLPIDPVSYTHLTLPTKRIV